MNIDRVFLGTYGPLRADIDFSDGLTVVRGPNESGKSLLVEAILELLTNESAPNAVIEGSPEGFIELSQNGTRMTVDRDVSLCGKYATEYDQELHPAEIRNTFIIRRGDLTFDESDEFYTHVTDTLTGRRVDDIDAIIEALIERGRLTPTTLDVSKSKEHNYAGKQLETAKSLREDIIEYLETATDAGHGELERDLLAAKQRRSELAETIDTLEAAQEVCETEQWIDELAQDVETIEANRKRLASIPPAATLEDVNTRLESHVEATGRRAELKRRHEQARRLATYSIIGAVLAFGVAAGVGVPDIGLVALLSFLGGTAGFWYQSTQLSDELATLEATETEIFEAARAAGIDFEDRADLQAQLRAMREERTTLEQENQRISAVLKRELDIDGDTVEEILFQARAEIERIESTLPDQPTVQFDPEKLQDARDEYGTLKDTIESLEDELTSHRHKLDAFEDRLGELDGSQFLDAGFDQSIMSVADLRRTRDRLQEFIEGIESDGRASRIAVDIFRDIQAEERQETAELFESASRASNLFSRITGCRYETVTYDSTDNQLAVRAKTGERLLPGQLSDGTKDQLYLSIRVALGERILAGQPGFFIMDDAFLTADAKRLAEQAALLEELVSEGWQVIYLTAKEDAIEHLTARPGTDVVELPPLAGQ